jgi:hypothetical protein
VLESPGAVGSGLFRMARQVVRLGEERGKPNDQRLPEFRDTALDSLEQTLYAPAPIEDGVETALLTRYLDEIKPMNEKEVPVKAIFGGKTAAQVAEEAVHSTKLRDMAERKRLAGDKAAAAASADGMIRLARLLDEPARRIRKRHQDALDSLDASAAERIAQYRYRLFGAADYPDATGTPRLTFGVVKAYKDRTEAPVLDATTFGGLFHLAANSQERYALPQRWMDAKPQLDLVTPMNFVSTCDITAGASGGPVLNAKGEIVGVTFDGNLESIALTYMYADDAARAVHVSTPGIVAALRKIYKATGLLSELGIAAGE